MDAAMDAIAWLGLIWCAGMSVILLVMLCLCVASGRKKEIR